MGDPQPRKRKEKRKKKDDSDEGPSVKAPSPPKDVLFNEGDSVIHVHHDEGTGGHWCAKIIFFALLAILVGLIGLIIIENRGLTDLDTPVAESRFSQVFDGWVDEGPIHDDHHDEHTLDLKHPEGEHDDHDEGFDEAHDEEVEDIESENEHDEHEEEHSDDEEQTDEHDEIESDGEQGDDEDQDDEEDKAESNEVDEDGDDNVDVVKGDDDNDDDDDEEEDGGHDEIDDGEEDDAKSDEKDNDEDDDDNEEVAQNSEEVDDDDMNLSFQDEEGEEYLDGSVENNLSNENEIEENRSAPFEEVDSGEEEQLVDNAAIEEEHLAAKRAEKIAQEQEDNSNEPKPVGGNSIEDEYLEWDGDDDDNKDWNQQLNLAQAEMDEGDLEEAYRRFTALSLTKPNCWRAKYGRAKVLDALAEKKRNNNLLKNAIGVYEEILDMKISDQVFVEVSERLIDRIKFSGKYLDAVPYQNLLIKRFPKMPKFRNDLAILYLMVNKPDLARPVLSEILKLWPNDGVALVHHGFILKTVDNNLEEAVKFLQKGIYTKDPGALDGRFLFHLGDALARLGHKDRANEIYKLGAELKVFLSAQQRSLYNVDRLKGMPWWTHEQTPYANFLKKLEFHWEKIAQEAKQLRPDYKPEQENLKDVGDWSQYELFARGVENKPHCAKCPMTCQIIRSEPAAWGCRRGQVKFSAMFPGTHVFAHTGPTNCRLRAHLGLQGTKDTFIRVGDEIRSWERGKVIIFDDSFEHEVWHNGTKLRIVLIVDLWHPELTKDERTSLPAI